MFCNAPHLITSQVSYRSSKRLEGLGKSGSNRVITEPMSKTGLSKLTYICTKEQTAVLSKKKAVATKCISTALKPRTLEKNPY